MYDRRARRLLVPSQEELDGSQSHNDGCVFAPALTQNLRIQSSCAICSQAPRLSRDMDGPSRTEASSSPWCLKTL